MCTQEQFLNDVAEHQMRVAHDDGLYRHLVFKKSWDSIYWFELVTWPGVMAIHGDCGSYLFSRLNDMFEFFRDERGVSAGELHLNEGYWAEKLHAQDCHGKYNEGVKRWCPYKFERAINECYADHVQDEMKDNHPAEREELRIMLDEEVISCSDNQESAISAAYNFDEYGLSFEDIGEGDYTEWNSNFIWCLYAIVWGIRQYDAYKVGRAGEVAS